MADVVAADIYIVGADSAAFPSSAGGAEFVGLGISGYTPRWQ
jgi:hypothetical protein